MKEISYSTLFFQKFKEIEHIHTFKDYFEWIKNNYSNRIFFEYSGSRMYNCEYFFKKCNAISVFLKEKCLHIKKESWIGLKLPNHPYYMILIYALQKNGFNVLLIDDNISDKNLNKVIETSGIAAIVTDKIIDSIDIMYIGFEEILKFEERDEVGEFDVFADKIALCSSGTEGNIKISVYNGDDFFEALRKVILGFGYTFPRSVCYSDMNKIVVCSPFFHLFGIHMLFIYFSAGITIVINENISLSCFLKNINSKGVQMVAHVPIILDSLFRFIKGKYNKLSLEVLKKNEISQNIKIFIGGGASTTARNKLILKKLGICYIDCYGTTEAGLITMNKRIYRTANTEVGVFKEGLFFNQGYGEMVIYGKGIRTGILENGVEILKLNSRMENAIKTGDLVEINGENVSLMGRSNDIIIGSNGENIMPNDIEEHFSFLKDCCSYTVLGLNEKPVMVVFLERENRNNRHKEFLISEISEKNRELRNSNMITSLYFTLMPIPLTPSLKVKRAYVKQQIIEKGQDFEKIDLVRR